MHGVPTPRTEIVTAGGLTIRFSIQGGRGDCPLLLINGIGAPLELWGAFRDKLGVETIAFDAPGTGASVAPRRPRTMWELARTVSAHLDQLGYGTVDVLGISWGGGLAQYLAVVRKSRVRRLILVCTAFGLGSIPANPRVALELLRPARYFSPSHLARVGPALFGGETRRHPELLRHQAELRSRHRPSTRGYLYQLVAASTWVSLPLLPLIQAKTLCCSAPKIPSCMSSTAGSSAGCCRVQTSRSSPAPATCFCSTSPKRPPRSSGTFCRPMTLPEVRRRGSVDEDVAPRRLGEHAEPPASEA